mmetsp:Transcript_14628/g.49943  ORF Transcript_14628/g.49943 Transcript_14628/m.49943 type:complete len:203 (+) Transcript_14628:1276-1884(+)
MGSLLGLFNLVLLGNLRSTPCALLLPFSRLLLLLPLLSLGILRVLLQLTLPLIVLLSFLNFGLGMLLFLLRLIVSALLLLLLAPLVLILVLRVQLLFSFFRSNALPALVGLMTMISAPWTFSLRAPRLFAGNVLAHLPLVGNLGSMLPSHSLYLCLDLIALPLQLVVNVALIEAQEHLNPFVALHLLQLLQSFCESPHFVLP